MSEIDIDQLRKILEGTMSDLAQVLPDAQDWRPTLIYMLEILDHQARTVKQQEDFKLLLEQIVNDLQARIDTGAWS